MLSQSSEKYIHTYASCRFNGCFPPYPPLVRPFSAWFCFYAVIDVGFGSRLSIPIPNHISDVHGTPDSRRVRFVQHGSCCFNPSFGFSSQRYGIIVYPDVHIPVSVPDPYTSNVSSCIHSCWNNDALYTYTRMHAVNDE